jgi:hypothetical protein
VTYAEIIEVATKEGLVRWEASGIIEYLRVATDGTLLARRFKTNQTHPIRKRVEDVYHCVEITRDEALRLRAAAPGDAA